jgi:magnesium transporter
MHNSHNKEKQYPFPKNYSVPKLSKKHKNKQLDGESFYHPLGTNPGTIVIKENAITPKIDLIDYNQTSHFCKKIYKPEECADYLDTESVSWVDVKGLGNKEILQRLGKVFNLHPLVLEDVVNLAERPKVEEYDEQLVIISRMVVLNEETDGFDGEQVSLVLGRYYLLSIQEEPLHDCFDQVRERLYKGKGLIRKKQSDYLAYALLDSIVDGYFPVLEKYGERIQQIEDEVINKPSQKTLEKIYQLRRELLQLRRFIWPQRDAINSLIRDGNELISDDVRVYLRDCYDHKVQVMDMVETYRELASGLMDVYLSVVSNKMNEIMKLLTIVSSIFVPLTFVAGVYGMNFEHMPELKWYWSYPIFWIFIISFGLGLFFLFKSKGWIDNSPGDKPNSVREN